MADRVQESGEALERVSTLLEKVTFWGVALMMVLVAVLTLKNLAASATVSMMPMDSAWLDGGNRRQTLRFFD